LDLVEDKIHYEAAMRIQDEKRVLAMMEQEQELVFRLKQTQQRVAVEL
jgi:hypothetical protein